MASYTISPIWGAGAQLFDNSGNVLTGGKIYTYYAGTTTPLTTYINPLGTVANSNPIIANAAGRLTNEIWFPVNGSYKFVLKDANDVLLATYDNIPTIPQPPIVNDASSISYETGYIVNAGNFTIGQTYRIDTVGTTNFVAIGASANVNGVLFTATGVGSGNGTAEYVRTVESKLHESVSVKDFGAIGDGITDDTAAFNAAAAASKNVLVPEGTYYLGSNVTATGSFFMLYGTTTGAGSLGNNGMARANSDVFAVSRSWDNQGRGLQIGGADPSYGLNGNVFACDGHFSWTRMQPSKNETPLELVMYATAAQGVATSTVGTNKITRISGSTFQTSWEGKKFYFGETVYRVISVTDANNLTVSTPAGGAVSFASTYTEIFHFAQVTASGLCNVAGNTVTRISGDPFTGFINNSEFEFTVNGTAQTVISRPDINTYIIAASLNLSNVPYTWSMDVNDQLTTLRIQKMWGSSEENMSLYSRYDGYWIQSQYAGSGKYRDITLTSGEPTPGSAARQVVLHKNGDLSLCGAYDYDTIRILKSDYTVKNRMEMKGGDTGNGVAWRSRGADTNVDFGIDTKGTGKVSFTSNAFGQTNFVVYGDGGSGSFLTVTSSSSNTPVLSADGAASNIDIRIAPKGTGKIVFGNVTSVGGSPAVTGYVEVKDYSGVVYKLAVIS